MGIDIHSLNLLGLAHKRGADFSSVLTIGRQALQLDDRDLAAFLHSAGRPDLARDVAAVKGDGYCERLLKALFGAKEVQSVDASAYENASIVHDMNFPLSGDERYSIVLDFGSLEHIFNFPVAVGNVIRSCKAGGHILHALPGNNWCGHGFYQFSPELFFNLYSAERGFRDTEVFLVELHRPETWYRVRNPFVIKTRVNVINRERTYVFVMTKKMLDGVSPVRRPPQQSDYVEQWSAPGGPAPRPPGASVPDRRRRGMARLFRLTGLWRLAKAVRLVVRWIRHRLVGYRERLHEERDDMEIVRIRDLMSGGP